MSDVSTASRLPTASNPAYADELADLPGFDRTIKKSLDQTDFLKLLSVQLANQDPLSPSSDLDSISQMASFTSAQQMGELVTSLKSFIVSQDFASTQAMLGKYVTVTTLATRTTDAGATLKVKTSTSGVVTASGTASDGSATVTIGGQTYRVADISAIDAAKSKSTSSS